MEGPGPHPGEGLRQGEDLEVAEEGHRLQEEGLHLEEGGHPPQGGEVGQAGGRLDHLQEDQEDHQPGLHEADPAVQQGAGDTRHPAAQTPPARTAATRLP